MKTLNLDYREDAAYYGDCADIMAAWKKAGVQGVIDLIYADPPFNSNRNYGAPTAKAKKSDTGSMDAFTDMWTYDQQAMERVERILKTQAHPARLLIASLKDYLLENDAGNAGLHLLQGPRSPTRRWQKRRYPLKLLFC